jgi:outer membrane receptor protein involved in Fe transport
VVPRGRLVRQVRRQWVLAGLVVAIAAGPASVPAQSQLLASVDSAAGGRDGDVLARPITVRVSDMPLVLALNHIAREASLRLSYSSDVVPLMRRVTLALARTPVGDVLREALRGTDIDPVVTPSGYVVLVRGPSASTPHAETDLPANGVPHAGVPPVDRVSVRSSVMDRVIVMGTPAAGAPERELASAVTVLTASQIAASGAATMQDLLRSGIPGIVAWDLGISGPFAQIGSVRGSSSFTANYLKTYVDGVELASPYLLFAVDPYSIERIEIIRGPQGSALYGSDAISGVVHVVTRKGSPTAEWRPQVSAQLSGGLVESRYVDDAIGSQRHSAVVSTGGGLTSLGIGGSWSETGGIVPGGESGYRSLFAGGRHVVGFLRIEGTMRYADVRFTAPANPLLRADTLLSQVRSVLRDQRIEDETYGITFDVEPVEGMRHTLVFGLDRHEGAIPLQREPATVADALLGATRERVAKVSLRFSSAIRVVEHARGGVTLTMGTDHTDLDRERLGDQVDVSGAGDGLAALYHDEIRNQGIFGQLKADLGRTMFVTAGLRGDWNSTFGENFGAAWSPMLGVSSTRDVGPTTVKLRAAYGKGIRPPPPSARQSISTLRFRQVSNPFLEPEAQSGVEGGIELLAGDRASLSLTGYSQRASGLIQQVILDRRTIQYQNVGEIHNRGLEVEAHVRRGSVRANATLSLTDSRVRALSSTYSGDLRIGDRVTEVPLSTGSAAVSWDVGPATLTAGSVFIGSWTGYDWARYVANGVQETTTLTALRSYWREYPGIVRPYLSLQQHINRDMEWFARVDNLTNVQRYERDNLQVTAGRTMTVGLRIGQY